MESIPFPTMSGDEENSTGAAGYLVQVRAIATFYDLPNYDGD